MQKTILRLGASLALSAVALAAQAASLEAAARKLNVDQVQSIEFSGTGRWFQFGQAPAPRLAWPQFDVSRYVASVDYGSAGARVQIQRLQTIDPKRVRPTPIEQQVDQYVSGNVAWNVGVAPAATTATAQPAAMGERQAEIWATPQGFVKAALANKATTNPTSKGGLKVQFTVDGKARWEGTLDAQDQVTAVRTWIDNPVLGDTLVETQFGPYVAVGDTAFPSNLRRSLGGNPVLDIVVNDVKVNATPALIVPDNIASAPVPTVVVSVNKLADGVFYLTGGTHHSVAIEQRDHIVLVEAPLNEARSIALIDKVKETFPGKPIKYLVNTHAHFDHSGGLRTFVAEGSTIVTHQGNVGYYRSVWSKPHGISPDRLATEPKAAKLKGFKDKLVLTDGQRRIEVHALAGNTHNDAFALVYLPAEKILIEVDAYTPLAPNAKAPITPNPYAVNLQATVGKLKIDVAQIAALHGPGVVKLADLQAYNAAAHADH